mmetsp:Transcript_39954/g.78573  ORF Transcript_39954/g.78573 Transcript_39954/m.78573 type:complete len:229 (-) Transcript_39954:536-1222(-)
MTSPTITTGSATSVNLPFGSRLPMTHLFFRSSRNCTQKPDPCRMVLPEEEAARAPKLVPTESVGGVWQISTEAKPKPCPSSPLAPLPPPWAELPSPASEGGRGRLLASPPPPTTSTTPSSSTPACPWLVSWVVSALPLSWPTITTGCISTAISELPSLPFACCLLFSSSSAPACSKAFSCSSLSAIFRNTSSNVVILTPYPPIPMLALLLSSSANSPAKPLTACKGSW